MGSRAVFADTNLGTHIAINVSPDITAGNFKREIERAHFNCFPTVGEIRANGLMVYCQIVFSAFLSTNNVGCVMYQLCTSSFSCLYQVKQKSFFYHLPDSLPIKYVFRGAKGAWFIHMEVCCSRVSDKSGLSDCLGAETRDQTYNSCKSIDSLQLKNRGSSARQTNSICRRTKRGIKRIPYLKSVLQLALGTVRLSKRKKRKRLKKNHFLEEDCSVGNEGIAKQTKHFASRAEGEQNEGLKSSTISENASDTLSETVSVSGIIKKYFSDYEEVTVGTDYTSRPKHSQCREQMTTATDDNCSEAKASPMPQFTPKTPPRIFPSPLPAELSCKTSRNKITRTQVGKRLVVASNNLSISASRKKSVTGLFGHRDRKLLVPESSSLVRHIVFQVSDNDE